MAKKNPQDYEKLQFHEQRETNTILWINTIFTILAGLGSIILPILEWWWHK